MFQWVIPHGAAEDEIEGLGGFVELSGDVQDVFVGGEGHSEGVTLHDTVEAEFLLFGFTGDAYEGAKFGNDVSNDGAASGVDHSFGATRKSTKNKAFNLGM